MREKMSFTALILLIARSIQLSLTRRTLWHADFRFKQRAKLIVLFDGDTFRPPDGDQNVFHYSFRYIIDNLVW